MRLLDRVIKTIAENNLIGNSERVVIGVSGGPDSLALLHMLAALKSKLQVQIHVAHLNHQLRGAESDADAVFVARIAKEWGLSATIGSRDVAAIANESKTSTEEAARVARYAFLLEVAQAVEARTIAVAHNADDQAETILMHLLRGAGLGGLRGMNYSSPLAHTPVQLIRPLLDIPRIEIELYCAENSLNPRADSSNRDDTFFRNRLRLETLPYLETLNPNVREILRRSARALADDYDFLQSHARRAFSRIARDRGGAVAFDRPAWGALHPSLQRATLRLAFERLRGDFRDLGWAHIEDARAIALSKNAGAQATLPGQLMLTVAYEEFVIAAALGEELFDLPQLHVEHLPLPLPATIGLPGSKWSVETVILDALQDHAAVRPVVRSAQRDNPGFKWSAEFDQTVLRGNIFLGIRKPGDSFQPAGMNGHTKTLHEFMIDEKIPAAARDRLPLLCDEEKILWVCGYRADTRARATDSTRAVLRVTFRKDDH